MKRTVRLLAIITIGVMTTAVVAAVVTLRSPLPIAAERVVFIPKGLGVAAASDTLCTQLEISNSLLMRLTARITARVTSRTAQYGWYKFTPDDTHFDAVIAVLSGRNRPSVRVTIPEGLTFREIGKILKRTADIDSAAFVAWCENDSIVQKYAPDAPNMEGYLMPDTYDVLWKDDAAAIGDRLARAAIAAWKIIQVPQRRHETLTLASIVQAEAGVVDEMPTIAGVYANRLRIGMRLEADPTVQYGMGQKRRLLYRDLDDPSAYNTYLHAGLPPGPICNPGAAAIRAAVSPEKHTYRFFVARGDSSARHRFASSATEHVANVARYRAARR